MSLAPITTGEVAEARAAFDGLKVTPVVLLRRADGTDTIGLPNGAWVELATVLATVAPKPSLQAVEQGVGGRLAAISEWTVRLKVADWAEYLPTERDRIGTFGHVLEIVRVRAERTYMLEVVCDCWEAR